MEKADYIFTRVIINDEDFLQKCIDLDQELKDALFDGASIAEGMNLINFLKMYYSNDEIIKIWWSMDRYGPILTRSTIQFFRSIDERLLFSNFKKVENNLLDLFREFINLKTIEKEWLKTYPIDFSYYAINNTNYVPV